MPLWIPAVMLVANLPFGYWRGNVRKFSVQWVLAIHIPVALSILLRLLSHVPLEPLTLLVMVGAFFTGQSAGTRLREPLAAVLPVPLTSCLIWDLVRGFVLG